MMEERIVVGENAGDAIRAAMKVEGLNQTQLAKKMNCNRQAVQQSLGRRSGNIRVQTLLKMMRAIGWEIVLTKCTNSAV